MATNTPDNAEKKVFTATLEKMSGMDAAYISIPFDVEKVYGTKGRVKVKATFDGHPYRGILANMGTGSHIIGVRKDIRAAISKKPGDKVKVTIELDTEERTITVPPDIAKALKANPAADKFFKTLSYTNRKEYVQWITDAKKDETRERRITESVQKLLKGLKNPSAKEN